VTFTVTGVTPPAGDTYDSSANTASTITLAPGGGSTANQPPSASFTYSCSTLDCTFTDTSTDSDGSVTGWSWDFGDGNGSTLQSPAHSYTAGGTYAVILTVTDDGGASSAPASQAVSVSSGSGGGASITLSASGYKVKGVDTVDLTWSGFTTGTVDITRNGSPVATAVPYNNNATGSPGSYTDSTGQRGGATFTYQVCQHGTSTCSNTFTVTF
jgi:PKD repeat protein